MLTHPNCSCRHLRFPQLDRIILDQWPPEKQFVVGVYCFKIILWAVSKDIAINNATQNIPQLETYVIHKELCYDLCIYLRFKDVY